MRRNGSWNGIPARILYSSFFVLHSSLSYASPGSEDAKALQQAARERAERVEAALKRLIDRYAGRPGEEDRRKRLEQALARFKDSQVPVEMEEVLRALEAGDLEAARERAAKARSQLAAVLEALTAEAKLDEIRRREADLESAAQALAGLEKRQQDLVDEASKLREASVPAPVRELKDRLDAIAREQAAIARAVEIDAALSRAEALLAKQRSLAGGAKAPSDPKAGDPSPGGDSKDPKDPKGPAASQRDLAAEARALEKQVGSLEKSSPGGDPSQGSSSQKQSLSQAKDAAGKAASGMEKASESLAGGDPKGAREPQAQAEKGLESLVDELRKARDDAAGSLAATGKEGREAIAARQEELARQADALSKQVPEAVKKAEASAPPSSGSPSSPSSPSEGASKAQAQRQKSAESAASRMKSAADEMKQAKKGMQEGSRSEIDAPGLTKQAVKSLAHAREELDRLERAFADEKDKEKLERLARKQRELAEETRKVAEALKLDQDLSQDAAQEAHKAADSMALVEGLFREEFLDSGVWEAKRALAALQRARGAVRQKQRQYATQQMKVTLSRLQADLDRLREGEREVRDRTAKVEKTLHENGRSGVWEEEEILALAAKQKELVGLARELKERFEKEPSVVFIWAARELVGKMESIEGQLAGAQVTALTLELEDQSIDILDEMLEGLKGLLGRLDEEERRQSPRPMQGGGDKKMPLFKPVDEVRVVLAMQKRLDARFSRFIRETGTKPALDAAEQAILDGFLKDQEKIRQLAQDWRLQVYEEQR